MSGNEAQLAAALAEVDALKGAVEEALSTVVHIHTNATLVAQLKAENLALRLASAKHIGRVVFREPITVLVGQCLELNFDTGEARAVSAPEATA